MADTPDSRVESPTTLDARLLKLAYDIENAMSGSPEFIGPSGLRFNVAERLRYLLSDSKARPQYGVRWISEEPKLYSRLDDALTELRNDARFFRNSRLYERTVTEWRPRPEPASRAGAERTSPLPRPIFTGQRTPWTHRARVAPDGP
jgi:hypothetical protein